MTFGERLLECIKDANKTQRQVAAEIDVSPTRLNYWVKDKCQPEIAHIRLLSKALGVTSDYLIGNESHEEDKPLSDDALAFARAYDKISDYGRAIISAVFEQEHKQKGAKRIHIMTAAHDSDVYAKYLSKREAEEAAQDSDLIIHHY